MRLSYEKLDVYQVSIKFITITSRIIEGSPKGHSGIIDQLRRASISIPLNIAEASGKTGDKDRRRFFAIARGSAMECGAIIDIFKAQNLNDEGLLTQAKRYLVRIVSMLTKLC